MWTVKLLMLSMSYQKVILLLSLFWIHFFYFILNLQECQFLNNLSNTDYKENKIVRFYLWNFKDLCEAFNDWETMHWYFRIAYFKFKYEHVYKT